MTNRKYDIFKDVVQILLPAFGAAYFSLSEIWGFPAGESVVGTVTVVATFLGVVLKIISVRYWASDKPYDGTLSVIKDGPVEMVGVEVNEDPVGLLLRSKVIFRTTPDVIDVTDEIPSAK